MLIGNFQLISRSAGKDEALSVEFGTSCPGSHQQGCNPYKSNEPVGLADHHACCSFKRKAISWTFGQDYSNSCKYTSIQKFGSPAKRGPSSYILLALPHPWLVKWSIGPSSNRFFATVLVLVLLDILWTITLEVIPPTIVGASLWMIVLWRMP